MIVLTKQKITKFLATVSPKCFYNWCFGVWWFMIWKPILLEQCHLDTAGAVPAVNLNCTLQFVRSPILPRHLSNAWKKHSFSDISQLVELQPTCHLHHTPLARLRKKWRSWRIDLLALSLPRDESSKWPAGWKNAARTFPAFLSQLNGT